MNRLWVRISLVIALVVIFVTLFPIVSRWSGFHREPPPRPTIEGISTEQVERFRQEIERRNWLSVLYSILEGAGIGLATGVLFSRWLAAPLRHLEQGARALAERRLDYRVPIQGSQEVRSVATAFNQMAEEMENAETLRRNLLADVTHELRHPVHILQGNLQAILDGVYPLDTFALVCSSFHPVDCPEKVAGGGTGSGKS